jgi:hypothetical protein
MEDKKDDIFRDSPTVGSNDNSLAEEVRETLKAVTQEIADLRQAQLHEESYVPNRVPQSEIGVLKELVADVLLPMCGGAIEPLFRAIGELGGLGRLGGLGALKQYGDLGSSEYQQELEWTILRQQPHPQNANYGYTPSYTSNSGWYDENYGK